MTSSTSRASRLRPGSGCSSRGRAAVARARCSACSAGCRARRKGTVRILGAEISEMPARRRDRFRADHIGFVFQMFNLVPYLTMVDNVTLPCRFSRRRRERATSRSGAPELEAHRLLARLGLDGGRTARAGGHRSQHRPATARRRSAGAHRRAGADHRRRADLSARRRHARALSRAPVHAVRRGRRVAAVREPRYAARSPVRSPRVSHRVEPRRERAARLKWAHREPMVCTCVPRHRRCRRPGCVCSGEPVSSRSTDD